MRRRYGPLTNSVVCGLLSGWAVVGLAQAEGGETGDSGRTNQIFRFAFTSNMFPEVNENDARAAMKVWIQQISEARHIAADSNPLIFHDVQTVAAAFKTNTISGVGLTAPEFATLSRTQNFNRLGVAAYDGRRIVEQYVVLVRKESQIVKLDQLVGRTLTVLESPRMSLATIWLDAELVGAGQKRCSEFFARVDAKEKASLVVLPVFFKRVDACLVTSNSFSVMGEMNPQLLKEMRVLAISPPVIPAFFAFCPEDEKSPHPELFLAMTQMHGTVAGKQLLALVKAECILDEPTNCLGPTLDLINLHDRLMNGNMP